MPGSRGARRNRPHRTWPQRLLIVCNCCVIVVCLLVAGTIGYLYSKVSSIGRVDLGNSLTPVSGRSNDKAQNFLIVGTDSAEGLPPNDPVLNGRPGGIRSDVIMVLRIDPASDHATLLSFPRDLLVPIAGQKNRDRINAAIQGGEKRLVDTIKQDFGIPINHYVEMNFAAFRDAVSAVDGVPMYFPTPARDTHSGLDIEQSGCVTLDPDQALALARSRFYEYEENGRWKSDPALPDLGRISRQQVFIRSVIRRAIDKGARNPVVLNELIDTATGFIHLDPTLTPNDLVDLGKRFKDFNPDNLDTLSVPVDATVIGGADYVLLRSQDAEPIFEQFRGADTTSPDGVTLLVQNGSTTSNLASAAAQQFSAVGFQVPPQNIGDAERFDYARTTIRYNPGDETLARLVASYLPVTPDFEPTALPLGSAINVVVGADWTSVLATARAPDAGPTTTTLQGSSSTTTTTSIPTDTATTTTIGGAPQAPEDVNC